MVAPVQGIQGLEQPVDGLVKRAIARPVAGHSTREVLGQRAARQLERVGEMAPCQGRIVELAQGDLTQRDVDPEVIVASGEGIAKLLSMLLVLSRRGV